MKWLAFALLLANMAFFAFMQYGRSHEESYARAHEPLQAARIKILGAEGGDAVSRGPSLPPVQTQAAGKPVCLQWSSPAGKEAQRVRRGLDKLQLGSRMSQRGVEEITRYWVYISPSESMSEAQKKAAALKASGIKDTFIIQNGGKWQHAVSLGVFKTREAAAKHLVWLQKKGASEARMDVYEVKHKTVFTMTEVSESEAAEIARVQQDFPVGSLETVECKNGQVTSERR